MLWHPGQQGPVSLWGHEGLERREDLPAPRCVAEIWWISELRWVYLLCTSDGHSDFAEISWETPEFGADLRSRPTGLRVWALVPALIK